MPTRQQEIKDRYALYHADCMEVMPELPSESVGISVYSPPFPEIYQYSDDPRDMCNCVSYEEAINQYRYVVKEVARLTKPGRLSCVHCTDLKRGILYQHDFPGDVIRVHEEMGMHFFCRVTIWKDAWEFARRTRMKTLMHKTIVENAANSRIAPADFLVVFKKSGADKEPVTHPEGFKHYLGERAIPAQLSKYANYKGDQRANALSQWIYRQYASPVWMDIRRDRLLPYMEAKDDPEERHVCPLQLDVIERCILMWSNAGDTLLTPFLGVGSEAFSAIVHDRRAIGMELKASYFRQAVANVATAKAGDVHSAQFAMDGGEGQIDIEDLIGTPSDPPEPEKTNPAARATKRKKGKAAVA